MNMLNDINAQMLLANSFVISIDDTQYERFFKIFNALHMFPVPQLFKGCIDKKLKPYQRCTQAHINLIKFAKLSNLPYVLVFEDDAYPCINCLTKINEYLQCLPDNAKMIILGWSNCHKNSQKFSQKFNRVTTSSLCGSHAYILFQSGFDDYLNFFKNRKCDKADNAIYEKMHAYVIDKPLFIQYSPMRSVINKHMGYIYFGDHKNPPNGFVSLEEVLSNSYAQLNEK